MKKMTPEELEQFIHRELRSLPARKAPAGFEARLQSAIQQRTAQPAPAPERLEQLVHRELRALPPRRAPRSLESRVLAALEHQAAVAWYHQSYAYWPAWARSLFLAASTGGVGKLMLFLWVYWQTGFERAGFIQAFAGWFDFATRIWGVAAWTAAYGSRVFDNIPPLWLYGGLAFVTTMYAAFFGLGATAYRTLYRNN